MRVSQLISELAEFIKEHGDLEVWVYANACAGHYNCEPYMRVDKQDGVRIHLNASKERVARLETEW